MRTSFILFALFAFGCHRSDDVSTSTFNHDDGGSDAGTSPGDGSVNPGDGSAPLDGAISAPADLGPPTGAYVWEVHGPMGPGAYGTIAVPVRMAATASTITGTFGSDESDTLGPVSWTVPTGQSSLVAFALDAAGTTGVATPQVFNYGLDGRPHITSSQMAVDSAGDVYVCAGFLDPTMTIATTNGMLTFTNNGSASGQPADFLYKMKGSTGEVLWATSWGVAKASSTYGTLSSACLDVAASGTSIVASYHFAGSIAYPKSSGGTTAVDTGTGAANDLDSLVVGIDPATGAVTWASHLGGELSDDAYVVAIEPTGDVLVGAGSLSHNVTIDGAATTLGTQNTGTTVPIFIELDATTHAAGFSKSWQAAGSLVVWRSLAIAPNGDILACGYTGGGFDFGTGKLAGQGQNDALFVRYDKTSGAKLAVELGGPEDDECNSIAADSTDEIVVGLGYESYDVKYDTHTFPNPFHDYAGAVMKLSATGSYLWGDDLVGMNAEVWAVSVLPSHDVLYAGAYTGTLNLGDGNTSGGDGSSTASYFVVRRTY